MGKGEQRSAITRTRARVTGETFKVGEKEDKLTYHLDLGGIATCRAPAEGEETNVCNHAVTCWPYKWKRG